MKGFVSFPEVKLNVSKAIAILASSEKTPLQEQVSPHLLLFLLYHVLQ